MTLKGVVTGTPYYVRSRTLILFPLLPPRVLRLEESGGGNTSNSNHGETGSLEAGSATGGGR